MTTLYQRTCTVRCVQGRGDIFSQFKIHLLPDNYIMLESVKMPGHFVNMTGNGRSKPPASVAMTDPDGQFYVRVSVSVTGR